MPFQGFLAAEKAITSLAVEALLMHRRVFLVLFERFLTAEIAIACLAMDGFRMHG